MDGRRSFPEDQESRWYSGDRGYGEPDWRADGEDRYRGDDFRTPEQRSDTGERRYGDLTEPPASRYAEPGRYDTGDVLGGERVDADSYRPSRSRRADSTATGITGSDLRSDRVSRRSREGRAAGDDLSFRDEVDSFRDDSEERPRAADPLRQPPFGGYPVIEPSRTGDIPRVPEPTRAADAVRGPEIGRGADPGRAAEAERGLDLGRGVEVELRVDLDRSGDLVRGVDPVRAAEVGRGADAVRADDAAAVPEAPHPLEMPTGPMPAIPAGDPVAYPAVSPLGRPAPVAGEGVYRTRRPALAILIALLVLVFEVPALRVLAHGLTADPAPVDHVVVGIFLVGGLPIFGAGLYGLRTGGLALSDGSRGWLRPPTAYLTIGLVLFLAAALAA